MGKGTARDLESALDWHGRAAAEILTTLETISDERWAQPLADGKWTVGQLSEHLALSYDAALDVLAGGPGMRAVLPPWKTLLLRLTVLRRILAGRGFPEGAPAPRELRPKALLPRAAALSRLRSRIEEAEGAIRLADPTLRMTHAYFGRLSMAQTLRVQAAHLEHHQRQIVAALPAAG
jgi:hypothetical protein